MKKCNKSWPKDASFWKFHYCKNPAHGLYSTNEGRTQEYFCESHGERFKLIELVDNRSLVGKAVE